MKEIPIGSSYPSGTGHSMCVALATLLGFKFTQTCDLSDGDDDVTMAAAWRWISGVHSTEIIALMGG